MELEVRAAALVVEACHCQQHLASERLRACRLGWKGRQACFSHERLSCQSSQAACLWLQMLAATTHQESCSKRCCACTVGMRGPMPHSPPTNTPTLPLARPLPLLAAEPAASSAACRSGRPAAMRRPSSPAEAVRAPATCAGAGAPSGLAESAYALGSSLGAR